MIHTICNALGCTRRRKEHKKLTAEIAELTQEQEKQRRYQAKMADEDNWFRRVCLESEIQGAIDGRHIETPLPVHSSS